MFPRVVHHGLGFSVMVDTVPMVTNVYSRRAFPTTTRTQGIVFQRRSSRTGKSRKKRTTKKKNKIRIEEYRLLGMIIMLIPIRIRIVIKNTTRQKENEDSKMKNINKTRRSRIRVRQIIMRVIPTERTAPRPLVLPKTTRTCAPRPCPIFAYYDGS